MEGRAVIVIGCECMTVLGLYGLESKTLKKSSRKICTCDAYSHHCKRPTQQARDTTTNRVRLVRRLERRGERGDARFPRPELECEKSHGKIRTCFFFLKVITVRLGVQNPCLSGLAYACMVTHYSSTTTYYMFDLKDLKFTFYSSSVRSSSIFFKTYGIPFQVQWSCTQGGLGPGFRDGVS